MISKDRVAWYRIIAGTGEAGGNLAQVCQDALNLLARSEQAEAERDDLRARLTGAAIHARRLTGRIAPGTEPWTVLAALLAALEAPAQATTEEKTNDG